MSKKMQNNTKSNTQGGQNKQKGTVHGTKKQQGKGIPKGPLEVVGASQSRVLKQYNPREKIGKAGSRCIKFKEFVQDIAGSVAFSAVQFQCNPGLANLFAWLSGQALFYQEYSVKSLSFLFETEKATNLSGKVMFAFLQDSADDAPASKQEFLENLIKAAGAVWQPFQLRVGMDNFPALGKSRFVRSGELAANLDVKTYDIGQLVVGTQGMADATDVGELYIEYEIELRTPIQSASQLSDSLSAKIVNGAAPSATSVYATTPTISAGLDITATGNTITFNRTGEFFVAQSVVGTGLFTAYAPTLSGTATSKVSDIAAISNAAANVGTAAVASYQVKVTSRGQTFITDHDPVATTITGSSSLVSMYPYVQ